MPKFEEEYGFGEEHHSHEKVNITDASLIDVINSYCGHEAGVRNLRKCIDRIFRKIVAKLEMKKIEDQEKLGTPEESTEEAAAAGHHLIDDLEVAKHYQINTKNLE